MEKKSIEELLEGMEVKEFLDNSDEIRGRALDFLSNTEGIKKFELSIYGRCDIHLLSDGSCGINYRLDAPYLAPILAQEFFMDKDGNFSLGEWQVIKEYAVPSFAPQTKSCETLREAIKLARFYSRHVRRIQTEDHKKITKRLYESTPKIPERRDRKDRFDPYSWKDASLADCLEGFVVSVRQLVDDWRFKGTARYVQANDKELEELEKEVYFAVAYAYQDCANSLDLLFFGGTPLIEKGE